MTFLQNNLTSIIKAIVFAKVIFKHTSLIQMADSPRGFVTDLGRRRLPFLPGQKKKYIVESGWLLHSFECRNLKSIRIASPVVVAKASNAMQSLFCIKWPESDLRWGDREIEPKCSYKYFPVKIKNDPTVLNPSLH